MKHCFTACYFFFSLISLLGCRIEKHPPEVWSLSPSRAPIGTDITITGAQFGNDPVVLFGTLDSAVTAPIKTKTDQTLTATVPRQHVGTTQVRVQTQEGVADPLPFTILQPAPQLGAAEPGNGLPGTTVRLTGDFLDELRSVRFGNVAATILGTSTAQSLLVTVPDNVPRGPITITVETAGGSFTGSFIVAGTPEISGFTPKRIRPGTTLTIQGKNLTDGVVTINGQPVDNTQTRVQDTQIQTIVPANATSGKLLITVFNTLTAISSDSLFVVGQPVITSLNVQEGIQGDKVVVDGLNLGDVSGVTFGTTAASFRIVNDRQLEVTVPALPQSGELILTVTGLGGTASASQAFVSILPPASLSPDSLRLSRGSTLTIRGQNLHRVTSVRIGDRPAVITGRTEGSIVQVTVPADAVTGPVTVTNRAGSATTSQAVIIVLKPTLTDFTPKALVGGRVVLKGTFLQNASVVFAGSAGAALTDGKNEDTELWVRVPADAQTGPICVTNTVGTVCTTTNFTVATK